MAETLLSIATEGWWVDGFIISAPDAPVLAAVNIDTNQNDLEWTPSSYAEYFKIFRSVDGGAWTAIGGDGSNKHYSVSEYSDNSVTAGHSYRYKVVAYNDAGASGDSNIVTIEIETANSVIDRSLIPFRVNPYLGIRAPIKLFKMVGGKGLDHRKLRYNFEIIEAQLRGLTDANFRSFAAIAKTKLASIVFQDEITLFPAFYGSTTYPPTRNLIPRFDSDGGINLSSAVPMKFINVAGTEGVRADNSIGAFVFEVNSGAEFVCLSEDGWTTSAPAQSAPDKGFAIIFDEARSLWLLYKDDVLLGVVDGNGQTNNFLTSVPATTYACEEAHVRLGETAGTIEFFCKTSNDATLKGCGYIDSTGTHDGEV